MEVEVKTVSGLHAPHDGWFRVLMEIPEFADDFIRRHIPPEIAARLDDALPVLMSGLFVTHGLERRTSDLVFRLKLREGNKSSHLYVIIEHQSTRDPAMAVRTGVYRALLRDKLASIETGQVPPILVLVAYHGKVAWDSCRKLEDMIPCEGEILEEQGTHRYLLSDLPRKKESELADSPVLTAGLLMLVYVYREKVTVSEAVRLLAPIPEGGELEKKAILYMTELPISLDQLQVAVRIARPTRGDELMETARQVLQREGEIRGEIRGEARGKARGRAEMLLELLEIRFGALPENVISEVNSAPLGRLRGLAGQVLGSREEVNELRQWIENGRSPAH